MNYIRWFHEIQADDVELVGGKGANLGEMTRAELPVPPGFCLTAHAYREFIFNAGLDHSIRSILDGLDPQDVDDLEVSSGMIRDLIIEQPVPDAIALEVLENYDLLSHQMGLAEHAHIPVAVRSSATAEDLPTASFAGQQDTYLNVCGQAALLDHIKSCWASLWTARAVTYRAKQGFDHHKVYLAVVVQAMIPSEVSGIMFTANPVDGNLETAVINASWGLGEAIVSGLVTPDTLTVHKTRGEILSRQIASKACRIIYSESGGVVELETPAELRDLPALSDENALELADLGCRIESHYGTPQDIEWAYAQGRLYVLQVRPVTTLQAQVPATAEGPEYNRTMFIELFPDPLTPIFVFLIQEFFTSMLDFTFHTLGFEPPRDMPAVGVFYNQPYFNREYIASAFAPLTPEVREQLVDGIVNPFGDHKGSSQNELSLAYARMVINILRFMRNFPKMMPGLLDKYHSQIEKVHQYDPEQLADQQLVGIIRETIYGSTRELLNYDFLMIAVIKLVYQYLGTLLEPYFGEEAESIRGKLISGVTGNLTMETNINIWDLAQFAKASPQVAELFRGFTGDELLARLGNIEDGRAFLEELDKFLKVYGHREVRMDIIYPTWRDDPSPILNFIRGYLDLGQAHSPHAQQKHLSQQRQEIKETVRNRLRQEFKGRYLIWPIFSWLLDNIEFHARERDTMHFEMTRIFPPFRRFLLELGQRWTERGLLVEPDQIFFLTFPEIEALVKDPQPMLEIASQRQEEYEASKDIPWPDIIRGDQESFARPAEPVQGEAGRLDGVAGSPGVITGQARVIRGPEEFHRLQHGEILVAPLTNPVWTPLFAIASAVITEVGGILSHGAIVAREYGIPAVMSIANATQYIFDGQTITVDGDRGLVYTSAEAAA